MKQDIAYVLTSFVVWRVLLFILAALAIYTIPLQKDFLGGGRANYITAPYFWGWANFDGEHYLSIARTGYKPLTHFYFPLYPLVTKAMTFFTGGSLKGFVVSGLIVSNFALLVALTGFYKLVLMDYKSDTARLALLLLLVFPTSYYFGSLYTESIFLALAVWSFYSARRGNWFVASVLAGLASATRVVGVILLPALIVEWLTQNRARQVSTGKLVYVLLLAPLGVLGYMYFLYRTTGDPLEFFHTVGIFGAQRSSSFIILPQVYYRYIIKILPNLSWYWPVVYTTVMEFATATLFLILTLIGFRKLRLSYWVYLTGAFIIPTLSGSFSSMPRYVLILFPGFILMAQLLTYMPKLIRVILVITLMFLLSLTTSLFVRGFWVS